MTNELSKPRDVAEKAFTRSQGLFYGRGDAMEEMHAATAEREAKTARLREARLAKDRRDLIAATAAKLANRAAKG